MNPRYKHLLLTLLPGALALSLNAYGAAPKQINFPR